MKKIKNSKILAPVFAAFAFMAVNAAKAHAVGVAYFTLPTDFTDNTTATIVAVFGGILVVLALMFSVRKTTKTVNRT